MKKTTRVFTLLLIVAMLLSLATGCNSSGTGTDAVEPSSEITEQTPLATLETSESPAVESAETPAESVEQTTIDMPAEVSEEPPAEPSEPEAELQHGVYRTYSEAQSLPLTEEKVVLTAWDYVVPPVMAVINDYSVDGQVYATIQELTGITLNFTTANLLTATESMTLMVNANELPDIIFDFGMFYNGNLEDLVDGDIIINFREYENLMPNYFDIMNNNTGIFRDASTDMGYLPMAVNIQDTLIPSSGAAIRQDFLDELNMPVPETIDELYDTLVAFQTELDVTYPLWVNAGGTNSAVSSAFGISTAGASNSLAGWICKDGKMQFCVTMDEYEEYITLMAKWYSERLIDPDFFSYNYSNAAEDSQISGNRCGVWGTSVNGLTNLGGYEQNTNVQPIKSFVLQTGDLRHFDDAGSSQIGKGGAAIACSNPEIELSVQLIDYFYSEDGIILQNYGVEGVSYTMEGGEPQLTELVTNNESLAFSLALIKYTSATPSSVTINSRNYLGYTEAQVSAITNWRADGELYAAPGQNWEVDAQVEYSGLVSDMNTFCDTEIMSFIIGARSMDEWDSFTATLTSSFDITRIQELLQQSVDSYLAKS